MREQMGRWGWMDRWMDRGVWLGGWMDGRHAWMDGRKDGWVGGRADERMDGRTDGWMSGVQQTVTGDHPRQPNNEQHTDYLPLTCARANPCRADVILRRSIAVVTIRTVGLRWIAAYPRGGIARAHFVALV